MSFTICFGSYAGFHIAVETGSYRLCLGWVAFTFYPFDLEVVLEKCMAVEKLACNFTRDLSTNYDCDTGANGSHPYYCRKCGAAALLKTINGGRP